MFFVFYKICARRDWDHSVSPQCKLNRFRIITDITDNISLKLAGNPKKLVESGLLQLPF